MMKLLVLVALAAVLQLTTAVPAPIKGGDIPPKPKYTGKPLKEVVFDPNVKQLPWEKSGLYQGDIMLNDFQTKNGIIGDGYRWPSRTMPYYIDPIFTDAERNTILAAVNEYNARTCVNMRPYQNGDVDYIYIQSENTGCWSYIGRLGGGQLVNLQKNNPAGCVWVGTAVHEFLHAWGFYHQQSATERDSYVTIMWDNIQAGTEHNFDKYDANTITSFGVTYDYGSVMHYGATAFSKNGQPTIVPLQNVEIGQSNGFSNSDIVKLERMYGCQ